MKEATQKKFKEILGRIIQLHEIEQKKILISEKVDLTDFLSYTQKDLNFARTMNSHEFISGRFDNDIRLRESLQRVIVKLIESNPLAGSDSHRVRALAHLLKVEVSEAQPIQRKDQKPKQFEKAFDSFNPKTKNRENPYREPTQEELENVIQLLKDFPNALREAKARLQKTLKGKE